MTKQFIKNVFSVLGSLFTVFAIMAFATSTVRADMCTTQYGGTQECKASDLTVNKQVRNPSTGIFVENLTTTDPTYVGGSEISYRLIITNNSGETFNPVHVKDILPSYISGFIAGSPGTFDYDSENHWVTFDVPNLYAGETRSFDLRFRVADTANFPAGKSLFCISNVAEVRSLNRFDSDSAQACLGEGEVLSTLPVAGFSDLAVIIPFIGVTLGGVALLKKKGK
jgi:uncharacterized repeat protein (TIGR01451 family)